MDTTRAKRSSGCLKITGAVALVGAMIGIAGIGRAPVSPPRNIGTTATDEASQRYADGVSVRAAERQVRGLLRDPDSATFSNSVVRERDGARVVCGYVNARNGFGGYTGDTMWIVVEGLKQAVINQPGHELEFARQWNKYCAGGR